jgi:O-methyltransferase
VPVFRGFTKLISFLRFLRNLVSPNVDRRLMALKVIAERLLPDFRLTWPQMDWWRDPGFNAYLERFDERGGFNTHRRWMLWQLLRLIRDVPGDTAECGVYEGSSSWLICSAIAGSDRTHHLFDSFEGLSTPQVEDGSYWNAGALAAGEQLVARNLAPFASCLAFHKGWIPDRFGDVTDSVFAFIHVDVDLHQPTSDALRFFYPRLSAGGVLVCDDYGCTTCPGATEAIDRFLSDKPEKMISLDAGGGFLIKGKPAAAPTSLAVPHRN